MAKKEINYTEAMQEIEKILHKLESGETNIDTITKDVERASELIELCKIKLSDTEKTISKLL